LPIKWGGPSNEARKTEAQFQSRCGMMKIPTLLKGIGLILQPFTCYGDVSISISFTEGAPILSAFTSVVGSITRIL
jgi:hypothetical protein